MTRTALQGIAETVDYDLFRPGAWFDPFGTEPARLVEPSRFQPLLQRAKPAMTPTAIRSNPRFPLGADEPHGTLLVTPAPRAGMVILLQPDGGNTQLLSLWPFVDGSGECEIEIDRILLAPNRLEAMIRGTLPGGAIVTWHDVFFAEDRVFHATGSVHSVLLAGLVHEVVSPQTSTVTIPPDNPAWCAAREHVPDPIEDDGGARVRLAGGPYLIPSGPQHPEWHEVQGPVKKVETYPLDMFGKKTWVVTATVVRDETHGDLDLPLHVSDAVAQEQDLPKPGDDFAALIRLTGRLWLPNVRERGDT